MTKKLSDQTASDHAAKILRKLASIFDAPFKEAEQSGKAVDNAVADVLYDFEHNLSYQNFSRGLHAIKMGAKTTLSKTDQGRLDYLTVYCETQLAESLASLQGLQALRHTPSPHTRADTLPDEIKHTARVKAYTLLRDGFSTIHRECIQHLTSAGGPENQR